MPKFAAVATDFTTPITTPDTAIMIQPDAAGETGEVIECLMTGSGLTAAADTQHTAQLQFSDGTGNGTGTAQTPQPLNQGSAVSEVTVTVEHTAEPSTISAVAAVLFGFNQRGGMRWAVPRGEGVFFDNSETNEDLIWTVVAVAAGKIDAMVHWWEH